MIGLASAGCSNAVSSRPNAALVAESKRSGSSSSGGAVVSGMSSAAGAGVAVFLGCRRSCSRTSSNEKTFWIEICSAGEQISSIL